MSIETEEVEERYMGKVKLEESALWKKATKIAEAMYDLLDEFPEEERYIMSSRLRSSAFYLTSDIAESVGAVDPNAAGYQAGVGRRNLLAVRNAYRFATKQNYFALDPAVMVELDALQEALQKIIDQARKDVDIHREKTA